MDPHGKSRHKCFGCYDGALRHVHCTISLTSSLSRIFTPEQTEIDFAQIAGAGLTWVRLALPYWAIQVYDDEPFLEGVAWQYFLKLVVYKILFEG